MSENYVLSIIRKDQVAIPVSTKNLLAYTAPGDFSYGDLLGKSHFINERNFLELTKLSALDKNGCHSLI